jgi:general secretion pathway protein G
MKYKKSKKAFTMIELVFVIVVIGILAGVAIPRLAATRDDAEITKGMTTLTSIRNGLSIERQKRILRGQFTQIDAIGSGTTVFGNFFAGGTDLNVHVLEYPELSSSDKYHWRRVDDVHTYFCLSNTCNINTDTIRFELDNGRFLCKEADANSGKCSTLGVTAE